MDLQEIQLDGFKSFADKTTIRFDDGVTCIVGPNGCGKSNVSDAVKWVLGEQSAKSLRGTNMQDVIFAGTKTRAERKSCEVTLLFNNEQRIFDLDVPEIAVTRRYKAGESKYFLNGQPCRQKDVVALFHSVGLGKEGYSIIGQGKVEQIMNAKPEDRRLIFEEATGLMVYKSRKQEIERKIEDATDNLQIYSQRIDEAERRLGPMKKQAESARKYNEYSELLKIIEANTYLYRYENAESEKEKYRREAAAVADEIISLNSSLDRINVQMANNRNKLANADAEIAELQDERLSLSVGNEKKSGEYNLLSERVQTIRSQVTVADEFVAGGNTRIAELNQEIDALATQKKKDGERLSEVEAQCDVLEGSLKTLDEKIAFYERLTEDNRMSQLSSADDLSELKKNLGTLAARKEAVAEKIKEIRAAIEKNKQTEEDLRSELAVVNKDVVRLQDFTDNGLRSYDEKLEEVEEMESAINNFNQELFSANGQLASLRETLEMYIGMKNRFDGYSDTVKTLMSRAKTNPDLGDRIHGVVADVILTDAKYETAIETAIGGAMQNIVTPTSDDAQYLIEYLKRIGGRASFLPVRSMRARPDTREIQRAANERGAFGTAISLVRFDDYYYNLASYLLGNTLICDNIANANVISKKYGNTFRIVTLDGDIVETSGRMTGGSKQTSGKAFLSTERKIQEVKEKIAAKEKQIATIKKAIANSEIMKAEAKAELDKWNEKYRDASSELISLKQRVQTITARLQELALAGAEYTQMLKENEERLRFLTNEEQNSSQSEEQLNSMRLSAQEELESQKNQVETLKGERAEKAATLESLKLEYTRLTAAIERAEQEIARLATEKEDLIKKVVRSESESALAKEELEGLEARLAEKELTEEEKAAVAAVEAKIEQATARKNEINENQLKLEEERDALQTKHQKHIEKRARLESEISRVEVNLENMRLRMEENYGLDYEGCLPLRKEDFAITEATQEASVLKRNITMLGVVNPNAEVEYQDEIAHYDEMVTQRDDIQKALDDLTSVLGDVRAEMLKIFNEGFKDINDNFKITFKELFGGGNAELQIDYDGVEDPLAAGVDIIASPPGKSLKKISLLSGGERALTAIAILFAILKARPMPFCILDEIEAALDDANVDRFASYLKRFADETQFIVITHRKPTMNQADSLFGVTMQEKGVSKIVSVKLSEVESKLGADAIE
ncbi:MAG: chromosome segregation protein SMC [Clostridia bacterium]|nr:chromosome segregation protein SMC [Clostridia bacterium]